MPGWPGLVLCCLVLLSAGGKACPDASALSARRLGSLPTQCEQRGGMRTGLVEVCSPLAGHSLEELPQIVSAPYDPPPPGRDERHQGVDFAYYRRNGRLSIQGVEVQSVLAGVVRAALADSFPYGNFVLIETPTAGLPERLRRSLGTQSGESLYLLYAHLEAAPPVILGERVAACRALGRVGKSGNAGIAHLHLEARLGPPGRSFTSLGYYQADDTPSERANYRLWRTSGLFRHLDPMLLLEPGGRYRGR